MRPFYALCLVILIWIPLFPVRSNMIDGSDVYATLEGTSLLMDQGKDYFLFYEQEDLEKINKIVSPSTIYPHLQAMRVHVEMDSLQALRSLFSIQIFPDNSFDNYHTPILPQQTQFDSDIAEMLGLDLLWQMGYNGSETVIAIMDNGIDFTHPLLQGKEVETMNFARPGTNACKTHGTPVAGLTAASNTAEMSGMAFGAKLVDVQLGCYGLSLTGDFLGAFDYLLAMNDSINVINTSFGGYAPPWDIIVEKFTNAGMILVGSAGNEGPTSHSTSPGGPGNSLHGISVGAVDATGELVSYSSRGPSYDMLYKPDILAPGDGIKSIDVDGGYSDVSGTSFASPIIAGGIATLISGLEKEGIIWNPGLIKAALMKSGDNSINDELAYGQGIANFSRMYEIIKAGLTNDNISKIVEITPHLGPISYLKALPKGMNVELPLTVVSSHPTEITIQIDGNISSYLSTPDLSNAYSQKIKLRLETNEIPENSVISGIITVSVGNDTSTALIQIDILDQAEKTLGIDLHHTYWDITGENQIGGSNIGKMIQLAMEKGYAIQEIHEELTTEILENIDLLWLPDPFNLIDEDMSELGLEEGGLTTAEIATLSNFVDSGGDLLLTTNGVYVDTQDTIYGLNTTGFNTLTSHFGIEANSEAITDRLPISGIPVMNQSSLMRTAEYISHSGNYLSLTNSWVVAGKDKAVIAYHQEVGKGKVIVSSSNYWSDNFGIEGRYVGVGMNNRMFATSLLDWYKLENQVIKLEEIITSNSIGGSFININDGVIDTSTYTLYVEENEYVSRKDLQAQLINGRYAFEYSISSDGRYRVIATNDQDYVVWELVVDDTPPVITIANSNPNNSIFELNSNYILGFTITDNIAGVSESSIKFIMDGLSINPIFSFDEESGFLRVILTSLDLDNKDGTTHIMEVIVNDYNANQAVLLYKFSIGSEETSQTSLTPSSKSDVSSSAFVYSSDMYKLLLTIAVLARSSRSRKY
ncbi:MAG: S8 family serine peptidase [Candidatus Heimdallarchaeota archaeon]|nr:S8 family serine peptidase [Candidatus Heimdallarchaeota archaeon]